VGSRLKAYLKLTLRIYEKSSSKSSAKPRQACRSRRGSAKKPSRRTSGAETRSHQENQGLELNAADHQDARKVDATESFSTVFKIIATRGKGSKTVSFERSSPSAAQHHSHSRNKVSPFMRGHRPPALRLVESCRLLAPDLRAPYRVETRLRDSAAKCAPFSQCPAQTLVAENYSAGIIGRAAKVSVGRAWNTSQAKSNVSAKIMSEPTAAIGSPIS
jgi:hypothetical protein